MGECWRSVDLSLAGAAGIAATIIALVLYCVSVGEETWAFGNNAINDFDVNMGLFKFCRNRNGCEKYVDNSFLGQPTNLALVSRTRAASSFVILAIVSCLATGIYAAFSTGRKGHHLVVRRAAYHQFIAAFLGFLAVCIFADIIRILNKDSRFDDYDFKPKGAFISATLAFILNLIAGILMFVDSQNVVYITTDAVSSGGGGMI